MVVNKAQFFEFFGEDLDVSIFGVEFFVPESLVDELVDCHLVLGFDEFADLLIFDGEVLG